MITITLTRPVARLEAQRLDCQVGNGTLTLRPGQKLVILGPNGSGKTLLVAHLSGSIPLESGSVEVLDECGRAVPRTDIHVVEFRDLYHVGSGQQDNYYQKRWQSTEVETSPLVRDILGQANIERNAALIDHLLVRPLLEERAIQLSSGQARKLTLVRALMRRPKMLIVESPFIGLDPPSRQLVAELLDDIARQGVQLVITVAHPKDVPLQWQPEIWLLKNRAIVARAEGGHLQTSISDLDLFPKWKAGTPVDLPSTRRPKDWGPCATVVDMRGVTVAYEGHTLVSNIDWQILRGQKWALLGPNGSGKSTLLSLITADNPQGYANDIRLFDRQRGSGESIWQIKQRIGYVSPDIHSFYNADISAREAVASGLFDSIGLYRHPNEAQLLEADDTMTLFGAQHLAQRRFLQLSYGEQRLVLLARAFVKRPDLLILDEPLHGLDAGYKALAKRIIEAYCQAPFVSLIYVTHYEDEVPDCIMLRKELRIRNRGSVTND